VAVGQTPLLLGFSRVSSINEAVTVKYGSTAFEVLASNVKLISDFKF
jgi:hypothetical protein